MKRFLCAITLIIVMIMPIDANAITEKPSGNLVTEYSVHDDVLKVKKVLELSDEYSAKDLEEIIKLNDENDNFEIDSIIIEGNNDKKEIKSEISAKDENYTIKKEKKDKVLNIKLKEYTNIKKISIEYSYKKVISHFKEYSFSYIKVPVSDKFMKFKLKEQKIIMDSGVKECWLNKKYSDFIENEDSKEIIIDTVEYDKNIIMAFDKKNKFLSYEKANVAEHEMESIRKYSTYTKLFGSVNKKSIGDRIEGFLGLAFVLGSTAVVVFIFIKRLCRKPANNKFENETYENNENKYDESYNDSYSCYTENYKENDEPFIMPSYINPAYVGILFNTCKEDIIFTILCELIRKDALEIKVDDKYGKDTDIHRKYILYLTENNVNLEKFEKEFLKDLDEIQLVNLEDIENLLEREYFDLVVKEANEEFDNYLRANLAHDESLDEISKNKNVELDKWRHIRSQMTRLNEEEMKKLTVKELELLHVFSTAVALRDKDFSLFKIFNSAELRVSKYFTEIQQTFDNGETVIKYLERTFLG